MLCASVEPQHFLNYFPSFAVYHGRYDELEAEDFTQLFWNENQLQSFKGYTPYWKHIKAEEAADPSGVPGGLTPKSEKISAEDHELYAEEGCKADSDCGTLCSLLLRMRRRIGKSVRVADE